MVLKLLEIPNASKSSVPNVLTEPKPNGKKNITRTRISKQHFFCIYQQRSILSAPKTNETKRKERRKEDEKEMHVQILSGPSLF